MVIPETRFVRSGDVDVAYQTVGQGEPDVVVIPGWISHCELAWELPEFARCLERLAGWGRLVLLDRRGVGLSDRVAGAPTLEQHMDDLRAVLDAIDSKRAVLIGWGDGSGDALLFAAAYPERVSALVFGAVTAKVEGDPAVEPWGIPPAVVEQWVETIESSWGQGLFLPMLAPSAADDRRFAAWWRKYERSSATPNAAAAILRAMLEVDVRAILPSIQVPTLVLHRRDTLLVSTEVARWFAEQIPGARYVELPGADILPYAGDVDALLDEAEEFLTGARHGSATSRVLATILFVDISGSTPLAESLGDRRWRDLLEDYRTAVRRQFDRFRGEEIDNAGDGFLATFDGPGRAVRCALGIAEIMANLGLDVHSGIHTGEVERRGRSISGVAVHIGARVAALAGPGEVLVTGTVRDLVVGSELGFRDRGRRLLKGVTGEWQLYAAEA